MERERSRRTKQRGGEPARVHELVLVRWRAGRAVTVLDDDTVDSVQVEDHVVVESGWVGTAITWKMAKLDDLTEGG